MMPIAHVLVVDDEPRIREVVQYALQQEGYRVSLAEDLSSANAQLNREEPPIDLIVLDITLPDGSGIELCRQLRAEKSIPVLFLSARNEEVDRVIGLEVGADDYLVKPFGTRELVARVRAVLRRTQAVTEEPARTGEPQRYTYGSLSLDIERHEVRVNDASVNLTHTEFSILQLMMRRPGIVFERSQLIDRVRSDSTHITERTMDTHIRRLRAKLREHDLAPIQTVHGVGYKFNADSD